MDFWAKPFTVDTVKVGFLLRNEQNVAGGKYWYPHFLIPTFVSAKVCSDFNENWYVDYIWYGGYENKSPERI